MRGRSLEHHTQLAALSSELKKIRALAETDSKEADFLFHGLYQKAAEILPQTVLPEKKGIQPNGYITFPDGTIVFKDSSDVMSQTSKISIITRDELRPRVEASLSVIEGVIGDLKTQIWDLRKLKDTLKKSAGISSEKRGKTTLL